MKNNLLLLISILLSSHFICLNGQDEKPQDILPESGSVKKWKLKKSPEIFQGEDLFQAIDGAAEVYLEYGFNSLARAEYSNKKKKLDVEIYQMKELDAAFGIMTSMNEGEPINVAEGQYVMMRNYYGMILKGRYFVIITDPSGKGELGNEIREFVTNISGRIAENSVVPDIIRELKVTGIRKEVLFHGDIVLNNHYYLGIPQPFNYEKGLYLETAEGIKIIFRSKDHVPSEKIILTTLKKFEDSGRYTIDYQTNTLKSNRGDTVFITTSQDEIIISVKRP